MLTSHIQAQKHLRSHLRTQWGAHKSYVMQAEQVKTKEAEAKLASFTGTLQQRLLQLATEVSLALPLDTYKRLKRMRQRSVAPLG